MKTQKFDKPICISYIRFSTPEQIKGNSLKRQLQSSQEYAEKHRLVLEERFNYKDLGLSAYHGDHKKKGALGQLLELVDSGLIPKGSVLLIESLDRLSRDEIMVALSQFIQILSKGLKIVTLLDGNEYDKHSNAGQIQYSLGVMARAYDESATKSKRLKAAWKDKRLDLDKKKLTAIAPAWLKLNHKTEEFDKIPDRCEQIKRIYKLHIDGNGADKIARIFNTEHIPAWRSKAGWHKSYIQKVLHNRAVLGEFQPHTLDKRSRVAFGDPILKYYPQVISLETFNRVQERMRANGSTGGRNGSIRNLFGHVAKCGYCGAPMQYVNKGKGDEYLTCDNARRGRGCEKASFRYKEFEAAFLNCCSELDVKSIMPSKKHGLDKKRAALKVKIEGLSAGLRENKNKQINLNARLGKDTSESFREKLFKMLEDADTEEKTIKAALSETEKELERLTNAERNAETQLKSISELLTMLQTKTGAELVAIRQKLRLEIRKLVLRVEVFPEGLKGRIVSLDQDPIKYIIYKDLVNEDSVNNYDPDIHRNKTEFMKRRNEKTLDIEKIVNDTTGKQHRCFSIWFQAGGFKEIYHKGDGFKIGLSGKKYTDLLGSFK